MKESFKSILALILALTIVLTLTACGGKDDKSTTAAPVSEVEDVIADDESVPSYDELVSTTENTEATEAAEGASDVEESSVAAEESSAAVQPVVMPTSPVEVLSLYNHTINNAFDAKVGFYKERVTDGEKLDAGVAFKAFKSLVYKFMGIGAENKYTETVAKGKWDSDAKKNYLRKSTLAASDINNAACTKSGDNYIITINVKNGSTKGSASSRSATTSIDKCGICVGNEDKGYYDHKTGPVIYDAIDDTFGKAVVDESYSGATVKATINAQTGNLVSLTVEYDIKTTIDTGSIGTATATGRTHIKFTKFAY